MIYEYNKEIGQSYIHYTFEINAEKVRLIFYQYFNKDINDRSVTPKSVYGKLIDENNNISPLFGISFEPITLIEKSELIENVINCVDDFINNHNSCKYTFRKVIKTENLIDKANDYNSKVLEVIGEENASIETEVRKGKKTNQKKFEYVLSKKQI